MTVFHTQAQKAIIAKDAATLLRVVREYETWRRANLEPYTGADNEMSFLIEGFMLHKGALQ